MWFGEARNAEIKEPNAMILATANAGGAPSQRTVLLKGIGPDGFVFYTNYESRKGKEMAENSQVSVIFPWYTLERQVIISGVVHKVSMKESEAYFHSRPRGSQLGAWVSDQSEKIPSREFLEGKLKEAELAFENKEIPLPENWGGYRIVPSSFEFWQGRESRLHDRIFYEYEEGAWTLSRLSP